MNTEQSISIMKALADKSRLAIVNSLLEQPQYVEEIARRHALAPSTVSFHLKKLEKAGIISSRKEQYYVVVEVNHEILEKPLREIVASAASTSRDLQDQRMDSFHRKVLASFFKEGILEKLPAQHKKRLIVLERFALRFEPGRRYSELEVTNLIRPLYDDYCTIRRLLVDEGLICREADQYWRDIQHSQITENGVIMESSKPQRSEDKRARLKREYKESRPSLGIFQIRNKVNGKVYLGSSNNLEAERKSRQFQIKVGKIVFNRELQNDLVQFGADQFEFSVLDTLREEGNGENPQRALQKLKLQWLAKLQPFGEKGYNSRKGFEREKNSLTP